MFLTRIFQRTGTGSRVLLSVSSAQSRNYANVASGAGFRPPPLNIPPPFRLAILQNPEINLPQSRIWRTPSMIRIPPPSLWPSQEPQPGSNPKNILDDPATNLDHVIEAPTLAVNQEKKEASRMIGIRRIKMNRHKLKKLRRKMKYIWAKIRLRRAIWREKNYLNEEMVKIKAAWKFDAKTHVEQLIRNVRDKPIPQPWIKPKMPDSVIKEQLKIREEKRKKEFLSILDKRTQLT